MEGKNIRIGLFGISRSGKNYTISNFISEARKHGLEFLHVSPIDMVRERLNGKKLSEMNIQEKMDLIYEVRGIVDDQSLKYNIIVDEHYCFPSDFDGEKPKNGYFNEKLPFDVYKDDVTRKQLEVVFPRFESRKYDTVAVLNIEPKIIQERMRTSKGCKQNSSITVDQIEDWQKMEISLLKMEFKDQDVGIIDDPDRTGIQLWQWFTKSVPDWNSDMRTDNQRTDDMDAEGNVYKIVEWQNPFIRPKMLLPSSYLNRKINSLCNNNGDSIDIRQMSEEKYSLLSTIIDCESEEAFEGTDLKLVDVKSILCRWKNNNRTLPGNRRSIESQLKSDVSAALVLIWRSMELSLECIFHDKNVKGFGLLSKLLDAENKKILSDEEIRMIAQAHDASEAALTTVSPDCPDQDVIERWISMIERLWIIGCRFSCADHHNDSN